MDQIKENPFLSAYTAMLVVGAAILGFLSYQAYGNYKEAKESYDSVKRNVASLKNVPEELYPAEKNRKTRTEDVTAFSEELLKLEKEVLAYQPPASEVKDAAELQQKIRTYIEEVRSTADLSGVTITNRDAFALGMEEPLAILPRDAAIPDLDFQLEASKKLWRGLD